MRTLVVLAGGLSSRMGRDKVLTELDGMTFIERILKNAADCFEKIIISTDSNGHADAVRSLPLFRDGSYKVTPEFVIDQYERSGPMGGLISVFEQTDTKRFAVISADIPFADMHILSKLYDSCRKKACFLQLEGKRPDPLIASYDRSAYSDIKRSFEAGMYKMRLALSDEDTDIVTEETLTAVLSGITHESIAFSFSNCNTPEDLERLIQLKKGYGI